MNSRCVRGLLSTSTEGCGGEEHEGRRVDRACPEVQAAFLELMVLGKVCGEGHSRRTGTTRQGSAVGVWLVWKALWFLLQQPYS